MNNIHADRFASAPDLRASRAVKTILLFMPGVTPGVFVFVIFGTTRLFRQHMYRTFVPRRWQDRTAAPRVEDPPAEDPSEEDPSIEDRSAEDPLAEDPGSPAEEPKNEEPRASRSTPTTPTSGAPAPLSPVHIVRAQHRLALILSAPKTTSPSAGGFDGLSRAKQDLDARMPSESVLGVDMDTLHPSGDSVVHREPSNSSDEFILPIMSPTASHRRMAASKALPALPLPLPLSRFSQFNSIRGTQRVFSA